MEVLFLFVKIRQESPQLYEVKTEDSQWAKPIKKLCATVSDVMSYFIDTSEKEDIERVEKREDGIHKQHEAGRIGAFINKIDKALKIYPAAMEDVVQSQRDDIQHFVAEVESSLKCAQSVRDDMISCSGNTFYHLYLPLIHKCASVLRLRTK